MNVDDSGQKLSSTRCTASRQMRSWHGDSWWKMPVVCPDCGHVGDLCWVRGTDRAPLAKTRAHMAPEGITPSPYGHSRAGGYVHGQPMPAVPVGGI